MSYFQIMPSIGTLIILFSTYLFSTQCIAQPLQTIVERHLYEHFSVKSAQTDINIVVNPINDHTNLKKCSKFDIRVPSTLPSGGRISMRISCLSPKKWATYATAKVSIYSRVATVKHPILKGTVITANDFSFVRTNTSIHKQSYFTRPDQLINLIARRNIPTGSVLTANMLITPKLIKRNDTVIIEAKVGALSVRTQGTALQSGKKGEQIKVLNNKSQKIIRAYVKSRGHVSVSR
ncbi:flagellar basal body P-ring formation chaperone FlgA [Neptunomonas sp.]|uniref:flagellar basal body P-ring formation chaperone FlgA n=1 Tax=Neptunomonas sp. TaxID=1971898 RepID=UPI0025E8C201|nr:flagellar basal body P-ring formation chaperone FlgA [Neptunomonas sp.]